MGTSKNSNGKGTRAVLAASLAAGVQKHFPAGSSLSVGGVMLTLAQIEAQLTGFASLRDGVETAKAALQAKVAGEAAQTPAMVAFMGALVRVVRGSFGNQPDVLADFGLQTETKPTMTVQTKVAAAAKREATRTARGTTSSKAKQAIHGGVTGVVVTPVKAEPPAASAVTSGTSAPTGNPVASTTVPPTPHS
jgi:hypothetical protein